MHPGFQTLTDLHPLVLAARQGDVGGVQHALPGAAPPLVYSATVEALRVHNAIVARTLLPRLTASNRQNLLSTFATQGCCKSINTILDAARDDERCHLPADALIAIVGWALRKDTALLPHLLPSYVAQGVHGTMWKEHLRSAISRDDLPAVELLLSFAGESKELVDHCLHQACQLKQVAVRNAFAPRARLGKVVEKMLAEYLLEELDALAPFMGQKQCQKALAQAAEKGLGAHHFPAISAQHEQCQLHATTPRARRLSGKARL